MSDIVRTHRFTRARNIANTTKQNKAFVLQSTRITAFEEREIPKLRDENDVRILIEQTGICGSDLHYFTDGRIADFVVEKPMIQGHESSGVVVEVGTKVKNVKVGDRVAIEPSVPCRSYVLCSLEIDHLAQLLTKIVASTAELAITTSAHIF